MNRYCQIILSILLLGLVSCEVEKMQQPTGMDSLYDEDRPLVEQTVRLGLESAITRVDYTANSSGLEMSWTGDETIGVYIYNSTSKKHIRAGKMVSTGTPGQFTGVVSQLQTGEEYVYLYPYIGSKNTIDYTSQRGELGSTAHLQSLIPHVWEGEFTQNKIRGYAIRMELNFHENPGSIHSITLKTMDRDGRDDIFGANFDISKMKSQEETNSLTLNVTGGDITKEGGVYKAVAYMASAWNADWKGQGYRTKYNVEVQASNGVYQCEYRSFAGQDTVTVVRAYEPVKNGKSHRLVRTMSRGAVPTVINSTYKVNSLLGMWNQYGKPYDPCGLIVEESQWPSQLRENRAAIADKTIQATTPTFLGPESGSLYEVGNSGNMVQGNVTFNNITITQPTEVFVTFISEYGWNENLLGYYHYTGEAPTSQVSVTKTLIFPNVSKPNHQPFNLGGTGSGSTVSPANIGTPEQAPLREFETVKLLYTDENGYTSTIFPAGTVIGLMMMIDTEAREDSPKSGYDLLNWGQWRLFTNTAWNAENTNWSSAGYPNSNFFASGDVSNDGTPIPGLAIYGVKDNATNGYNTAYGAMIFMVSTSVPSAMQTANKAYFNIGTGSIVVAK